MGGSVQPGEALPQGVGRQVSGLNGLPAALAVSRRARSGAGDVDHHIANRLPRLHRLVGQHSLRQAKTRPDGVLQRTAFEQAAQPGDGHGPAGRVGAGPKRGPMVCGSAPRCGKPVSRAMAAVRSAGVRS